MVFQIKPGVSIKDVRPETVLGMMIAGHVLLDHGVPFVLTSVSDGIHGAGSLHYNGLAFDCRLPSRYVGEMHGIDRRIRDELADVLGDEWDVVLEKDHLHIEFDPKLTATKEA